MSIKIKLDVGNGILEVEADAESLGDAMDRVESMLAKFATIGVGRDLSSSGSTDETLADDEADSGGQDNNNSPKTKKKKPTTGAKVASWKIVDDLLPEEKRNSLREFFDLKKPGSQNEMVAVLSCKLKELTGRDGFDGNEVYTAFQIVGKKTPGNLRAVFGNMTTAGLGNVSDNKFRPNFKAEDLVKHDLPPKAGKS